MNALADYAKRISSELVLFDWALFFQVMFAKHFFFFILCFLFCFVVVAVVVCLLLLFFKLV